MRNVIACLSFAALMSLGCQAPVAKLAPSSIGNTALPPLIVGREYGINVKSKSADGFSSYEGKVKQVDGDTVVLETPICISRIEGKAPPIVRHIPVLKRQFVNVGFSRNKSELDVTVNRHNISYVLPIEKSTRVNTRSDARETSAAAVPKSNSTPGAP